MAKTINAPGYEINELDMSQYDRNVDNSFDNAPINLVLGYGSSGIDSVPRWINTVGTFPSYFGNPETEEEKYFYNAAVEILKRNGICIAAKMPYDNQQAKNYIKCEYKAQLSTISELMLSGYTEACQISSLDSSIQKVIQFSRKDSISSIRNDAYQAYLSRTSSVANNSLMIVDISKSILDSVDFNCISVGNETTNECLGIIPVVFTAANALFYQGLIDNVISPLNEKFDVRLKTIDNITVTEKISSDNFSMQLSSSNPYDDAVANIATSQYPTISFKNEKTLLRDNLKYIGIAVFKAYADKSNDGKIAFQLVESFVGSLVRNNEPGSLQLIDDVVNEQSQYINVFSNIQLSTYQNADITFIDANSKNTDRNCKPCMLGFYEDECQKQIPNDISTLTTNAQKILDKLDNKNMLPIDVVVDAGMSTIAFSHLSGNTNPNKTFTEYDVANLPSINNITENTELASRINAWYSYLQLYNDFCANRRKDCMFISDLPRAFSLNGQSKIVNMMSDSTVRDSLMKNLKKFKKLNTSYGAGYATWLKMFDAYSGQQMWMPPSIKLASVYTYCDTYFHPWSAPAGLTRGVLTDVVDVSFNPQKQDCEQLYMNGWNYILSYPMSGIVVEGQKTFQSEATALDRVNVRRLMLYIERRVAYIAKYFVYENNTPYQRQLFADQVNGILTQVRNGSGISEFAVKCDDTNNTPATIDRNELHLSVAVKPVKTIEFIILNFALTNQSADVQETVARL